MKIWVLADYDGVLAHLGYFSSEEAAIACAEANPGYFGRLPGIIELELHERAALPADNSSRPK